MKTDDAVSEDQPTTADQLARFEMLGTNVLSGAEKQ